MQIERCSFDRWPEAYRILRGDLELVVVASIGPRVVSLRYREGPNILWNDPAALGSVKPLQKLSFYGGHRLWTTPEIEYSCYTRDHFPCEAEIRGEILTVTKPVEPETGLVKSMRFESAGEHAVAIVHGIRNPTEFLVETSAWALTCVKPEGAVFFPWGDRSQWDLKTLVYWQAWAGHHSDSRSAQWQPGLHLFTIRPDGEEGKVGSAGERGWIARAGDGFTFVKRYDYVDGARYPDKGCSVEVYTCAAFVELETLSPTLPIRPGDTLEHREVWMCLEGEMNPSDEDLTIGLLG